MVRHKLMVDSVRAAVSGYQGAVSGCLERQGSKKTLTGMGFDSAWAVRKESFPDVVYFSTPGFIRYDTEWHKNSSLDFVSVSITGKACSLGCDHCNGHILNRMVPATTPAQLASVADKLAARGCRGFLLSGGADENGSVPLGDFAEAVRDIKRKHGFCIVAHTGLVDDFLASRLAVAGIDAAMIDVIGSRSTIRRVCHLDASPDSYIASIRRLRARNIPVAPHVVLGLDYGRLRGEIHALRALSTCDIQALVLVVIIPVAGTRMAHVSPPELPQLAEIFVLARRLFPKTRISLGCARPAGKYKSDVEVLAIRAGFNGIAFPGREAVGLAAELGLRAMFSDVCCALSAFEPPAERHV